MLILDDQPLLQVPAILRLRGYGNLAEVGLIEVDARTGQVEPLDEAEIQVIREHALELVARLTLSPAEAG